MASSVRFFYKHAGYSYDPKRETKNQGRWRCARALARAERWATENLWHGEWEPEWDVDHSWCDCGDITTHRVFVCFLRDSEGTVLESLGNIFDPTYEYRRVVEAELALEAMYPKKTGVTNPNDRIELEGTMRCPTHRLHPNSVSCDDPKTCDIELERSSTGGCIPSIGSHSWPISGPVCYCGIAWWGR